jgi:hypothetical protein
MRIPRDGGCQHIAALVGQAIRTRFVDRRNSKGSKQWTLLLVTISILLAGEALAMTSANYRLDWYTPATTSGGGPASSTGYSAQLTLGQTTGIDASSTNYSASLGYWGGVHTQVRVFLPLILH